MLILLASLAGCAAPSAQVSPGGKSTPPLPQPAIVPSAWQYPSASEAVTAHPWWTALNDAVLNDVMAQALIRNPDIRIAEARLNNIRSTVADADPDERATAAAELGAAENDAHVIQLGVAHAVTTAYADVRLAEQRKDILRQRMQQAHDLTARLHRRLQAGLVNTHTLREAEQTEIETHQAVAKTHHDQQQALASLAMLSGMAPIEFKLPSKAELPAGQLTLQPDFPGIVIARRPDVQAAWQRLLASSDADGEDDKLPLTARIEQAESTPTGRDALYRKAVLAALQDVETTLNGWRMSNGETKASLELLEIQTANVHDTERELAAGRVGRIELLKAMLAENLAQENLLLAQHAQRVAFAAAQLALARD